MAGWFWHLLNDPVGSNPLSLALAVLLFAGFAVGLLLMPWGISEVWPWRDGSKGVSERHQAGHAIRNARASGRSIFDEETTETRALPPSAAVRPPDPSKVTAMRPAFPLPEPRQIGYADDRPALTKVAGLPTTPQLEAGIRAVCPDCQGRGFIMRAVADVLAERETELLMLKGSCANGSCRLHRDHAGPCVEFEQRP